MFLKCLAGDCNGLFTGDTSPKWEYCEGLKKRQMDVSSILLGHQRFVLNPLKYVLLLPQICNKELSLTHGGKLEGEHELIKSPNP